MSDDQKPLEYGTEAMVQPRMHPDFEDQRRAVAQVLETASSVFGGKFGFEWNCRTERGLPAAEIRVPGGVGRVSVALKEPGKLHLQAFPTGQTTSSSADFFFTQDREGKLWAEQGARKPLLPLLVQTVFRAAQTAELIRTPAG